MKMLIAIVLMILPGCALPPVPAQLQQTCGVVAGNVSGGIIHVSQHCVR